MTFSDIDFISHENIQNLSVQTSQKISKNNLTKFIQSNLQLNDIQLNDNNKVFFTFISEVNIYEIYIVNINKEDLKIEYFMYKNSHNKDYNYELFIYKSYYVVYKDNEFYFSKVNKNYEISDILNYVEYKYKIKISNMKLINKMCYLEHKNRFIDSSTIKNINFINLNISNAFNYYVLYLCICSVILFYGFFDFKKELPKVSINKNILSTNKDKLNILIFNLNRHKLVVKHIKYKGKYSLQISSKNINNIYRFLDIYKNKFKILNVSMSNKTYFLELSLES